MKKLSITRLMILSLLRNENLNGYQIIKRFDCIGKVSTGSVYPELKKLSDEGMIVFKSDDTKIYRITPAGKTEITNLLYNMNIIVQEIARLNK